MKNIILLTPLTGNGGIASWSHKFIKTFGKGKYNIIAIDRTVKGRAFDDNSLWSRLRAGVFEMLEIRKKLKAVINLQSIDILHTTTSGSLGTFRDFIVAWTCKKKGIPCVMHCRYGCIAEDLNRFVFGRLLRQTMKMYTQVWVLDSRSFNALSNISELSGKVFLTPNSITVAPSLDIPAKTYRHIAFVGNLIPTKGIYELVEAVCKSTTEGLRLSVVGTGEDDVVERIKAIAGDKIGKSVFILGRLPNDKAVEFMKTVDVIALPTYYPWEAFPISILEAMSLGKLVISTPRAAIKDMLTAMDGSPCGLLVKEKSSEDIRNAIEWCVYNPTKADKICRKAYTKVYNKYRTEVVYALYESLYGKLFK